MGSIREPQSRDSRDRMDNCRPLSPRRSRVMSDRDDRTLPPISQLLPNIDSSHPGRPRSRGSNHSPSTHYPPLSSSRGSSDHSPSYRYPGRPPASSNSPITPTHDYDSRYQGPSSYDLPYHSGPPSDRPHTTLSRDPYPPKQPPPHSSMPTSSSYATQASSYRASAYPPHAGSGDSRRREDEQHHTSLPPPPPFQSSSNGHSPYSESRGYPSADGRHDQYPPPPPPPLHPAYQHPYDAPRPYDPRMAPSAGTYQQPPQYSYSSMPPLSGGGHYSSSDEPARKRRGNLPRWTTDIFKAWFLEHIAHPYPSEQEKNDLCAQTGCSMTQISNWFINARRRQTPVLTRQAEAERRLRDTATGRSSSNSD